LGNRQVRLDIQKIDKKELRLQVSDSEDLYTYSLQNWLGLNQENYATYMATSSLSKRIGQLEGILIGQLLHFAEGVGWQIPVRFRTEIADIEPMYVMPYKGTPLSAFSLTFRTNLFLPSYIGLGKGASKGFGVLKFLRRRREKVGE
jgi:hypothetical protein